MMIYMYAKYKTFKPSGFRQYCHFETYIPTYDKLMQAT